MSEQILSGATNTDSRASRFGWVLNFLHKIVELHDPNFGYKLAIGSQLKDHGFEEYDASRRPSWTQYEAADIVLKGLNVDSKSSTLFLPEDGPVAGVSRFVLVRSPGIIKSQDSVFVTTGYVDIRTEEIKKNETTLRKWIAIDPSASEILNWAGPIAKRPVLDYGWRDVIVNYAA